MYTHHRSSGAGNPRRLGLFPEMNFFFVFWKLFDEFEENYVPKSNHIHFT